MSKETRRIELNVPALARVEGEGALDLTINEGQIETLQLRIYEPPRFFEKFLEGRHVSEVVDIVARICGICPVAYQVSAVRAFESLFDVSLSDWVQDMRRFIYLGEWIESHALHIHMLALPDFMGFSSGVEMAKAYPSEVRRGLKLQSLGNEMMTLMGGRSVHPIGIKIGGFYQAPEPSKVNTLLKKLTDALPDADAMVKWTASIQVPVEIDHFTTVALIRSDAPGLLPVDGDVLVSSLGHRLLPDEYPKHFTEMHVPHSTALWSHLNGQPYLVGPLARMNIHSQQAHNSRFRSYLKERPYLEERFPSENMFDSMLARAIEIHLSLLEAVEILERYRAPDETSSQYRLKPGVCYGWSEAPRGVLWHQYQVDEGGWIQSARIVAPTSQNQARIEENLKQSLMKFGLDKPHEDMIRHCETIIRNYDPCISCATH